MDLSLSELREMVMFREAWRAVIHGVAKSQTRLNDWTEPLVVYQNTSKCDCDKGSGLLKTNSSPINKTNLSDSKLGLVIIKCHIPINLI